MKKYVFIALAFLFVTVVNAQEKDNASYLKKGDVIEATFYYDNGKVSQHGFFNEEGKLHGKWVSYDVNGKKTAIAHYENGKKVGKWFFWTDESLKEVDFVGYRVAKVVEWTGKEALAIKQE